MITILEEGERINPTVSRISSCVFVEKDNKYFAVKNRSGSTKTEKGERIYFETVHAAVTWYKWCKETQ